MESLLSERARHATSSTIRDLLRLTAEPHILSMAGGLPAAELFPVDGLRRISDELLGAPATAREILQYGPTEGIDELRAIVATHADELCAPAIGARVDPAQVLITNGSQQALDLLARTLLDHDDVVVVESPSYLGALQVLRGQSPSIVPVDVDGDGLDTAHLASLLGRGLRPKLCYVVGNFSNPSGATLSRDRRRHLAALADRYGFLVIEDDPYGALRFRGAPVESIGAFGANVVRLGSSSKTLAPGLRVGWAIVPAWLMGPLVRQKQAADLHTSSFAQAIVARALQASWYQEHLARVTAAYARQADALGQAISAHAEDLVLRSRPDGGMFAWVQLPGGVDATALLPGALAQGVAYVPGAAFSIRARYHDHVRLSFATLQPAQLHDAIGRLVTATRIALSASVAG